MDVSEDLLSNDRQTFWHKEVNGIKKISGLLRVIRRIRITVKFNGNELYFRNLFLRFEV